MPALRAFVAFLREVLSENGVGSWSRVGSAVVVSAWVYAMIVTRQVPERTEELAWVLAALYGTNQAKNLGKAIAQCKQERQEVENGRPRGGKL